MWCMVIRIIVLLLSLALMPSGVQACSIVIQITLNFSENSAELDRTQIIRLANWLDQARSWYEYESAEVEGSSSTESPDSKNLALRRAEVTVHALQSLYPEVMPSAQAFSPSFKLVQVARARLISGEIGVGRFHGEEGRGGYAVDGFKMPPV